MANEIKGLKIKNLDLTHLQKKAEEAALKAAESEITNYYTGYDSPFRKALKEKLNASPFDAHFQLPQLVEIINNKLQKQVDQIADKFIQETLMEEFMRLSVKEPQVYKGKIKLSEVIFEYLEAEHVIVENPNDFNTSVKVFPQYPDAPVLKNHILVEIQDRTRTNNNTIQILLRLKDEEKSENNKESLKLAEIYSVPRGTNNSAYKDFEDEREFTLKNAEKMTMTTKVKRSDLYDNFTMFMLKLKMYNVLIELDIKSFEDLDWSDRREDGSC